MCTKSRWLTISVMFGIIVSLVGIGILARNVSNFKTDTAKVLSIINDNMSELYEQTSKLVLQQIILSGNMTENKIDFETRIQHLDEKLRDVDTQHILRGSVIVAGIFGQGSGTIIKKTETEMYIITCHHVIEDIIEVNEKGLELPAIVGYFKRDADNMVVGRIIYTAEIIKYNEDIDLALVKVKTTDNNLDVIELANKEPEKGDTLYSVGNPLGLVRTISKGILANIEEGYYIFDGTTTFGNSGGGLYNIYGELVGVPARVQCYSKNEKECVPESGLGLSIALPIIKKFLGDMETLGE